MATYLGHNEDASGNILLSIGNGMTATVETGTTASQAYTKGQYLFFSNKLCKASKAISSGATLTIGTNLTQTSLGDELVNHLRSSDGKEFYFDVKDGKYGWYPSASKTASEFVPFGGTCKSDVVTLSTSATTTVTVGFQPTCIAYRIGSSSASQFVVVHYDSSIDTKYIRSWKNASDSGISKYDIGEVSPTSSVTPFSLYNVTSTGFVIGAATTNYGTECHYFAMA